MRTYLYWQYLLWRSRSETRPVILWVQGFTTEISEWSCKMINKAYLHLSKLMPSVPANFVRLWQQAKLLWQSCMINQLMIEPFIQFYCWPVLKYVCKRKVYSRENVISIISEKCQSDMWFQWDANFFVREKADNIPFIIFIYKIILYYKL